MKLIRILVLFHVCLCASIGKKQPDSDKMNLKMLINQLTSLNGVSKYNLFIDRHFKCQVVQRLQGLLTKSLPIMSMKYKSLKWRRYERIDYRNSKLHKSREDRKLLNYPSRNALFLYVFSRGMFKSIENFLSNYCQIFMKLVSPGNIPKILLITITKNKVKFYENIFNALPEAVMDFEILEISSPSHALKKDTQRLKRSVHNFTVHQWNCFSRSYQKHQLSKNTTWFKDKLKNLHNYKMTTSFYTNNAFRYDPVKKKLVEYDVSGVKSKLAIYLQNSMNFTWSYREPYAIDFPEILMRGGEMQYLNPCRMCGFYFYTPVINDVCFVGNASYLLICVAVLSVILFFLHACRSLGGFDRRTWSHLFTVKMMIGLDSPYTPHFIVESVLFIMLSVFGIFCSNDIYEGLTDLIVPLESERKFYNLQDLKDSNLTLILQGIPKKDVYKVSATISESGVKYAINPNRVDREIHRMFRMLRSKKTSISVMDISTDKFYDSTIRVDEKVLARRSEVIEFFFLSSIEIVGYSIFKERLSMSYWRFFEHGFNNDYIKYMYTLLRDRRRIIERNLDGSPVYIDDSEESDFFTLTILLAVLGFGTFASLVSLLGETTYVLLKEKYK